MDYVWNRARRKVKCQTENIIYYSKLTFLLLLLVIGAFFLIEYIKWDTWQCQMCEIKACSERIYNLEKGGWFDSAIYRDDKLLESCKAGEDWTQLPYINHMNLDTKAAKDEGSPEILTKCGPVQPVHISRNMHEEMYAQHKDTDAKFKVPNIVHYISLGHWKFSFLNYMSFKSVAKNIKPNYIYIHGNGLPYGYWWNKTINEINNLYHVFRDPPERIQGRKIPWLEHQTDIMRLQTLLDNGGIYLDTDIIALKSFDDLRKHQVTLGRESSYGLGSGIIIAAPASPFICAWFHGYRTYNPWPWTWASYAVWTPNKLAHVMPNFIHIEEENLQRPSWSEPELLFEKRVDWSQKYAIHVWKRFGPSPQSVDEILNLNTTIGEVMRFVHFGSPDLRYSDLI